MTLRRSRARCTDSIGWASTSADPSPACTATTRYGSPSRVVVRRELLACPIDTSISWLLSGNVASSPRRLKIWPPRTTKILMPARSSSSADGV
jgi:hypothetical protein